MNLFEISVLKLLYVCIMALLAPLVFVHLYVLIFVVIYCCRARCDCYTKRTQSHIAPWKH